MQTQSFVTASAITDEVDGGLRAGEGAGSLMSLLGGKHLPACRRRDLPRPFPSNPCRGRAIGRDLLPLVRDELGDRFTVVRQIAHGGAARVFLARDASGQMVALKVLHPQLAVTVTADRFLREIGFLSRLNHPHIARLVDCGETDRLVYYVMTYVEGVTLREHMAKVGRATVIETLQIARDVLEALAYAHGEGIVHRDVKPDNIVLSPQGAVLLDFGIARAIAQAGTDRLTRSGFCVGTSAYMSPEQVRGGDDIDHRSDIYSLGCVLFECLSGRPPFTAAREEVVLRMHLEERAPDVRRFAVDVEAGLAEAVSRALAPEPEARWQTAAAMLRGLTGFVR